MRPRTLVRPLLAGLAVVAAAISVAGCGSAAPASSLSGAVVAVTERDFHISAPTHLKAGRVDLQDHNDGPDQHELIVVRAGTPLPMRSDGLTVDEEAIEGDEAGSLEPGVPGSVRNLEVNLKPGRYILFCNMEGHFLGGMHTELVVTG